MPPLALRYTKPRRLDGTAIEFKPLTVAQDDGTPDTSLSQPIDELVDLVGDGLPGILYSDDQTTLYWPGLGEGRFGRRPRRTTSPMTGIYTSGSDVDRSGRRRQARSRGTFTRSQWLFSGPFRRRLGCVATLYGFSIGQFCARPTTARHDRRRPGRCRDLRSRNGQGLSVSRQERVCGGPHDSPEKRPTDDAPSRPDEVVRVAVDMFGDGGSHIVRIRNGAVTCWPHLGYGRYGAFVRAAECTRIWRRLRWGSRSFWPTWTGPARPI